MLKARQQGWKPEDIDRERQMDMFAKILQRQAQPQQEEKKGGWLFGHDPTAWISELTGMGGAGVGMGIGTAILPGLGTLIGGGLGGLLGGGVGSGVEQLTRDKKIDWGKLARESALEGAFGTIPGVFKSAKLLKQAPRGAKMAALTGRTDDVKRAVDAIGHSVTNAGGDIFEGTGKLRTTARRADMRMSGLKPGQAIGGGKILTPKRSKELYAWGRHGSKKWYKPGVRAGTPAAQADDAQKLYEAVSGKLAAKVDDVNRAITKTEKTGIIKAIRGKVDKSGAIFGKTDQLDELIRQLDKVDDIKGLEILRKEADSIGWDLAKAGKSKAATQARLVRSSIDDFVTHGADVDDVYKELKGAWSKSNDLLKLTSQGKGVGSGTSAAGFRLPNTGLKSKVSSKIANAGMNFANGKPANFVDDLMTGGFKGLSKTGKVASQLPRLQGYAGKSGMGEAGAVDDPLGIGLTMQQITEAAQEAGIDPSILFGGQQDPMAQTMGGFSPDNMITNSMVASGQLPQSAAEVFPNQTPGLPNGISGAQPSPHGSPQPAGTFGGNNYTIPREAMVNAMMADLQATGGENMDKLIKFFEFANYDALNSGAGQELSADQKKGLTKMGNAEVILNQLDAIVESGMFPEGGQTPLASLGGLFDRNIGKHFSTEKKAYIDQLRSKGITIIRAMGEVGNLSQAEQDAAIATLPAPGDSLDTARSKLDNLKSQFGQIKQSILTYGGTQSAPTSNFMPLEQSLGGFAQ